MIAKEFLDALVVGVDGAKDFRVGPLEDFPHVLAHEDLAAHGRVTSVHHLIQVRKVGASSTFRRRRTKKERKKELIEASCLEVCV